MNIKEVERLSGMSRANIRFYEEKGLLAPARRENGYRDYSPQDVETLLRIRLLRSLQMPLEEIHALQTGEKTLDAALAAQAGQWERQCQEARRAQEICRAMRADGAVYATLDAKKYLNAAPAQQPPAPLPATDRAVYPLCPGRRYFARTLDAALCGLIWNAVLTLGFHCNLALRSSALLLALDTAAALLIMLALEPLFLHFFGTTPGKFLMGLRLEEAEGARLSLSAARGRTWAVLWQGCGLNAPIFRQYRLWKSYRRCRDGEISDWDAEYETAYIDCGMKKGGALLAGLDNGLNFAFSADETRLENVLPFNPLVNAEHRKILEKENGGMHFKPGVSKATGIPVSGNPSCSASISLTRPPRSGPGPKGTAPGQPLVASRMASVTVRST